MKFVYFGSFHLSADILAGLVPAGIVPSHVICSPDKPAGRKKVLTAPAVKTHIANSKWPIEILQPESPLAIRDTLLALNADFFLVMGYPQIIPQSILEIPRLGTIGVHPSLLPKYRGASPIQSALLAGEKETGVTLYQMDAKMDHGPILANGKWLIANGTTNAELETQLAKVAADLLIETLPKFIAGKIIPVEQNHAQATFTKKFTTAEGQVDMVNDSPESIYRKIQAFNPEPSVWTMNFPGREGVRVKLLEAELHAGSLHIGMIQPESKKPMRVK
jgi:methionyl-tRNA formyltransferase